MTNFWKIFPLSTYLKFLRSKSELYSLIFRIADGQKYLVTQLKEKLWNPLAHFLKVYWDGTWKTILLALTLLENTVLISKMRIFTHMNVIYDHWNFDINWHFNDWPWSLCWRISTSFSRRPFFLVAQSPLFLKVKFLTWHKHVIIFPYLLHYCPLYYIRSYIQGLFHKIFQSLRIIEYKKLQKH